MTKLEKAIKGMELCKFGYCAICHYNDDTLDKAESCGLYDDALELLRERQWISVRDRLPEEEQLVMTIDSMGFHYLDCYNYKKGRWEESDSATNPITHWMALPEPPNDED